MKRLKSKLLNMDPNSSTYSAIYEGDMVVIMPTGQSPIMDQDNTYWNGDVSVTIERSHKLALDKPTLIWKIPVKCLGFENYSIYAADYCLRAFAPYIETLNSELYNRARPDEDNGKYYLYHPGGEVNVRNTSYFSLCFQKDYENQHGDVVRVLNDTISRPRQMCLCIRMQVQLPKKKLRKTIQMLCHDLPGAVDMFIAQFDINKLNQVLDLANKQMAIRAWLRDSEYCAFLANGSVLPRLKGTDFPLPDAIPFSSPPGDEIEICGVRGMGIKRGVTVITGGGYSGKSTLLDAISSGIYDHVLGDGRELCITDERAMSISAEDGRSVKSVDISPFIKWLPGEDTKNFSTTHASGSTSQATNIMEAIDYGVKLLLIDEDRSATNFMIRDQMMKTLIKKEPIVPFTDRVNELYTSCGVSTILVIGGSGEYLSVADRVYMMDNFFIQDITLNAKSVCNSFDKMPNFPEKAKWQQRRILHSEHFTSYPEGKGTEKLMISEMGFIFIGDEIIDVRGLHNIVSKSQIDALGYMLRYLECHNQEQQICLDKSIDELYEKIENEGLDIIFSSFFTTTNRFLDLPRKFELKSVINRMRKINVKGK